MSDSSHQSRLVYPPLGFDPDLVPDLLVVLMANIEEALLATGASPIVDYSRLDLLQAATPFVVRMFEAPNTQPMKIVTDWPVNANKPTDAEGRKQ
ncbi:hypothetical protein EMIT0P100_60282 [Pseudomonas sp. IT-P100]|uniref:hypothetical protein n=1 Tax=Pseudomonas sp. IT-P100 TaxID=3026452 RepID=UPI0039E19970